MPHQKREKLAQLRTLMRETIPQDQAPANTPAAPGPLVLDYNVTMLPLEQTSRARAEREVHRIATWYGWQVEVHKALDRHGATYLSDLDDLQMEELRSHMAQLLDCAMVAGA